MVVHIHIISFPLPPHFFLKPDRSWHCPFAPLDVTRAKRKFVVTDISHGPLQHHGRVYYCLLWLWDGLSLALLIPPPTPTELWHNALERLQPSLPWRLGGAGWTGLPSPLPRTSSPGSVGTFRYFSERDHNMGSSWHRCFFKPLHSKYLPSHRKNFHLLGSSPVSPSNIPR